jgi:hypothetical protein
MEKENKLTLYFNMLLGTIGTILIVIFELRYQEKVKIDITGNAIIMFGFLLTVNYINYLEKKAGISNKLTWIRAIVSIIILGALFFLFK